MMISKVEGAQNVSFGFSGGAAVSKATFQVSDVQYIYLKFPWYACV